MAEKEVTVSSTQGLTRAISEVAELLETKKEAKITAINMAIPSAVALVEIIKHKIKGIHQQNSFEKVKDSTKTRVVFHLSFNPLDKTHKGYQAPINDSEVLVKSFDEIKRPPPQTQSSGPRNPVTETRREESPRRQRRAWGRGRGRQPRNSSRTREEFKNESRQETRSGPRQGFRSERRWENRGRDEFQSRRRGGGRGSRREFRGRGSGNYGQKREPGMEKYRLVRNWEESKKGEFDVFVSTQSNPIYAIKEGLLMFKSKGAKSITVKGSGQAIHKAVRVAEEIKRKEPGLHQQNSFDKGVFKDVYKPIEEGLDDVVKERIVEGLKIVLSKNALDTNHTGYQAPIPNDQVTNLTVEQVNKL